MFFSFVKNNNDLSGIKKHHVKTYCGCKCIKIDKHGYGRFELCKIHVERNHLGYGAVIVPEVKVDIPLDMWTGIKLRIGNWFK